MLSLRQTAAIALLASALLPSPAHADPPAMREEAAEPTLEIATEDRGATLAVGGFLQARAQGFHPRLPGDIPAFGLPRTRLYVFGRTHPTLRYRFMVGTLPYQENVRLFDAYGEWAPDAALRFRVGRFKIPVLRGWIESGRELATVERAPAVLRTLPGRAFGAMASASGAGERFEFSVGGFERRGDPALPEGIGSRALALRTLWNVTGRPVEGELDLDHSPLTLAVGASGTQSFAQGEAQRERLAAIDLALQVSGFDAVGEVGVRERGPSGEERTLLAYGRLDQYIAPLKSALGGRTSHLIALTPTGVNEHEVDVHLSWLPHGHDAKITGALLTRKIGRGSWSPGAAAQVQVAF
jgi:hypothetical protein